MDIINIAQKLVQTTSEALISLALKDKNVQAFVLKLNKDQLLKDNIDSEGVKLYEIGGEYKPFTQRKKGLGAKEINLYDTGAFQNSFQIRRSLFGFDIIANYNKEGKDLRNRWGQNITGLTKENDKKALKKISSMVFNKILS